jgi:SAM-dependent methyltransferase
MRVTPVSEPNYYGNVNVDLLRWIPLTARRVLELGCGEAALAAAYKMRNPGAEYVAVETHAPAAAIARARVDQLIEADFLALDPTELKALGQFDAIVLGDVLEHLSDPWRALRILRDMLAPDGRVALSVPNVSHWTALANLMTDAWPALDSGLFDRTHLRFFTLTSLQITLAESGLAVERARPRMFVGNREAAERWIPILADAAEKAGQNRADFVKRSQALQYVASAHRAGFKPPERLHIHFAALAPAFMDVRTRLPAEALESDPSLTVSYREKSAVLPDLPVDQPKVAVLQRLIMRDENHWRSYVAQARARGWTLVYEIDDHPDLLGRVHQSGAMRAQIRAAITRGCHAVQTSTVKLANALRELNPELAVFENAVMDLPPFQPRHQVRKVFYGALNREGFSAQVASALAPALHAHPELEFSVVHDRAFFDALPTQNKTFQSALSYVDYLKSMADCDIVLSPLEGSDAELYKSDVKFLEATRCGAAMIASPCVYEDTIQQGLTGLIAREIADWPTALARLVADPALRDTIAAAAWRQVRDHRMMAAQVAARGLWYRDIHARRDALDAAILERWPNAEAEILS